MDAHAAVHPTSQTLSDYGLGKLDDSTANAVNKHLAMFGLSETRCRDVG